MTFEPYRTSSNFQIGVTVLWLCDIRRAGGKGVEEFLVVFTIFL